MEYQIFHTLEESENYCSSTSIDEKKSKLLFDSRKDPFNTNSSLWGTSSVEFLKILLCTLYQIRDIYSNYESLNWLEKHGLAHLIVSATSAYVEENDQQLLISGFCEGSSNRIVYIPIKSITESTKRKIRIFYMDTLLTQFKDMPPALKNEDDLQKWLRSKFQISTFNFFINGVFDNYDPDDINYFGNYIHPKVKQLLGNKDTWKQIKNYRNLFAHPHEKINERALKMVCEIITSDKFIHSIEKVVFLLLPLLPVERQNFIDTGYHNCKENVRELGHRTLKTGSVLDN